MTDLSVRSLRGDIVETEHCVTVAVMDAQGTLVAQSADADLVTPIRSSAKPFQALPLVEDGVVATGLMGERELALACASHNSETYQVDLVSDWLVRLGLGEGDLACGPHPSLAKLMGFRNSDGSWEDVDLAPPSAVASNCSGKHTGMLALAKHNGWDADGYAEENHPVQRRCRAVLSQWCDVSEERLRPAVDGCGVVTWAIPLRALALAYSRLAGCTGAMSEVVSAMLAYPDLVAGRRRLCTAIMRAYPDRVVAKAGAGGVYGATLLKEGLGIAVKVNDGDPIAAAVALLAVLESLGLDPPPSVVLSQFTRPVVVNTNQEIVAHYEPVGSIVFSGR